MELVLTRVYFPDGTNGTLKCDGRPICKTIELPWRGNKRGVSCIPEGRYLLRKRYSVKFKWHVEVTGVEGRSLILIHPANDALRELNGCIAPVTAISRAGKGLESRKAFNILKAMIYKVLDGENQVILIVQS